MILNSLAAQTGVALCGGIAAETLHWYALSRKPQALPAYRARPIYWITTAALTFPDPVPTFVPFGGAKDEAVSQLLIRGGLLPADFPTVKVCSQCGHPRSLHT